LALALVVLLGGAALVIDGGNAFAQQRATQNGADAAAEAGAVGLAQNFLGVAQTDAEILAAIQLSAANNGVDLLAAYYTDIRGNLLSGSPKPGDLDSAPPPAAAFGVAATTQRTVSTVLASVVGLTTIKPTADATAIMGPIKACVFAEGCALLPVTVMPTISTCDGTNKIVPSTTEWLQDNSTVYILPLCSGGPGNVGWIDWTPPSGGFSDVIESIEKPNNPDIVLPSWGYVTQTGNSNAIGLEDAINAYSGQVVLIPLFNVTCDSEPDASKVGTPYAPDYGCPAGHLGGNGTNQWYRFPYVGALQLCAPGICDSVVAPDGTTHDYTQGAYINGGNAVCGSGNGSTGCLVGRFVEDFLGSGTVDQDYGGGTYTVKEVAVNLIK
jgi:Flp pilus assembly protein TadG